MFKNIFPLINGAAGTTEALGDEEAPTTKWLNPQWDQWFERVQQASGGKMPAFSGGKRGGGKTAGKSLPSSLQALDKPPSPWSLG